jgi:hypothetical protein
VTEVSFATDNEPAIETVRAKGINIPEKGFPASPKSSGEVKDEGVFIGVNVMGAEETEPAASKCTR